MSASSSDAKHGDATHSDATESEAENEMSLTDLIDDLQRESLNKFLQRRADAQSRKETQRRAADPHIVTDR